MRYRFHKGPLSRSLNTPLVLCHDFNLDTLSDKQHCSEVCRAQNLMTNCALSLVVCLKRTVKP